MIRNVFKGVDNATYDIARIGAAASIAAGIIYSGMHLVINHTFSIIEFGTGMGALIGLAGGGIAVKDTAVAKAKAVGDAQ